MIFASIPFPTTAQKAKQRRRRSPRTILDAASAAPATTDAISPALISDIANRLRAAMEDGTPLANRKYWILHNDGKYGARTEGVLGKRLKYTSIHAPDINAFSERFNQSIQDEY